jgi:hypothetical protein
MNPTPLITFTPSEILSKKYAKLQEFDYLDQSGEWQLVAIFYREVMNTTTREEMANGCKQWLNDTHYGLKPYFLMAKSEESALAEMQKRLDASSASETSSLEAARAAVAEKGNLSAENLNLQANVKSLQQRLEQEEEKAMRCWKMEHDLAALIRYVGEAKAKELLSPPPTAGLT